ncbi:hypothetical protein NHF46_13270 [Arthrobacter alpinus]|nr:hypothetical protein [Arthrobacter alpinus]
MIGRASWMWKIYANELGLSHERPYCAVLHHAGCDGVHRYAGLDQGTDTDVSRIAVIEDEPILARLLERILSGAGHTVTVAGSVAGGLTLIRAVDRT